MRGQIRGEMQDGGQRDPGADLRFQGTGLLRRGQAQFVGQRRPAEFVLLQRRRTSAFQRQQAHQLTVGLFLPGFQGQLPPEVGLRRRIVAAPFGIIGQQGQALQRLDVQPLTLNGQPVLKVRAILEHKAGQQVAAVEVQRLCQPRQAGAAGLAAAVTVRLRLAQQRAPGQHIHLHIGGGVELDGLRRHQQVNVADGLAQGVEGLAQVLGGARGGCIRPKERAQRLAAKGAFRLQRQPRQQAAHLVGFEARDRAVVQGDGEGAEKGQGEIVP